MADSAIGGVMARAPRADRRGRAIFRQALTAAAGASLIFPIIAGQAQPSTDLGWTYPGGSKVFDRYSQASQIDASNAKDLQILWIRPALDASLTQRFPDLFPSEYFKGTPIMLDGVLYAPNGVGLVEAFDAVTGETRWTQKPFEETMREAGGISTRGVDIWRSATDFRLFVVRGDYLYALDGNDGSAIAGFGADGRVALRRATRDNDPFFGVNGPMVVGDIVIVGGNGGGEIVGDGGSLKEGTPEDIRGYDVRTGKLVWTFHVMPQPSDPARKSWGRGSAKIVGHMGAWGPMSADTERNLIFVPLSSPTNASYGGHRPGDNLYANSLVAIDARTGTRVWSYQMVHHDIWDYDNGSPPTLGTIRHDGADIPVVIQPNKTGFLFILDRRTGKPLWPVIERPVPRSTVPGEQSSPTQPFPTKPEPFDRQGITEADLIDFTPELRAEALAIAKRYTLGPLFAPPSLAAPGGSQGTLTAPSAWGSGNWNTGAFDPETGRYYAVSMTLPGVFALKKAEGPAQTLAYVSAGGGGHQPERSAYGIGPRGLPLLKPPYGRVTAFDLNRGEQLWTVANGDGPRDHPALAGLSLPRLGTIGRPVPLLTRSLLFVGESSDAIYGAVGVSGPSQFHVYDKRSGQELTRVALPAGTTGGPITYVTKGRQIIVVPIGNNRYGGAWVALGLSDRKVETGRSAAAPTGGKPASFAQAQLDRGKEAYAGNCAACHGENLEGGDGFAGPLTGRYFRSKWGGSSLRRLFSRIYSTMPYSDPGSLDRRVALDITAWVAHANGAPAGGGEVAGPEALRAMVLRTD